MNEFSLIQRYFAQRAGQLLSPQVALGIGDDCALLSPPPGQQVAVSMDTLVAGRHFPEDTPPADIGYKALAVNLSDLAAMGATPGWFTLSLTLPNTDDGWLQNFSNGLFDCAHQFDIPLVGGDTTQGPLSITIQVGGWLPSTQALTRSGTQAGDLICVSGELGGAALGLRQWQQSEFSVAARQRLVRPIPRIMLGQALRGLATSAIDISDGLLADLGHMITASTQQQAEPLQAKLDVELIPKDDLLTKPEHWPLVLAGGDDYELCFTVPQSCREQLVDVQSEAGVPISIIGEVLSLAPVHRQQAVDPVVCFQQGQPVTISRSGFEHFSNNN